VDWAIQNFFQRRAVRKFLTRSAIGSISLTLCFFLILPVTASAQTVLSPWVRQVIDRSNDGIAMAGGLGGTNCDPDTVIAAIDANTSVVRYWVMTTRDLSTEAQFLRERTVCFENDRSLLGTQLELIRTKLNDAIQACNISAAGALRDNYDFTAAAYASLLKGGVDPTYRDNRLRLKYPFHNLSLWSTGGQPVFDSGSLAPLCPFTTDYAPHSYGYVPSPGNVVIVSGQAADIRSYGCDRDVLATIGGDLQQEALALQTFQDTARSFAEMFYNLMIATLPRLPGDEGETYDPASSVPPHEKLSGCLRPALPMPGGGSNGQDNSAILLEEIFAGFPDYFDQENAKVDPGTNSVTYAPLPEATLPVGLLLRSTYDFFLAIPNSLILDRSFLFKKADIGRARPLPQELTSLSFVSQFFFTFLQRVVPSELRTVSSNIEREMGNLEAEDRDAIGRSREALMPLTEAVDALSEIVTEAGFLPEKYTPDLTYFLLRSCVDGPCQQTLDRVMQRTFNPYCHPYVSGKYAEEDAYKKCYCDPSVQASDRGFWDKYCSQDLSSEQGRYDSMQPTLIPGCLEESSSSSSSSGS